MMLIVRSLAVFTVANLAFGTGAAQEATSQKLPLHRISPSTPADLRGLFRYREKPLPIVSAHRGGAGPGYPENCIETFEHTLRATFSMLEVDPRLTKDGEIVLHHDATLERTTTGSGKLAEKTLAELKQLRLRDSDGHATEYRIPTLDEAIRWAKGKAILVLDQKDVPLAQRVGKVTEHRAEAHVMLIVGNMQDVVRCHDMNPDIMMEVMITSDEKVEAFSRTKVPWENVIAFLGHIPPTDSALYATVHQHGASTMVGTSRNFDRVYTQRSLEDRNSLEEDYRAILDRGADIIETDLPRELAKLLFEDPIDAIEGREQLSIK